MWLVVYDKDEFLVVMEDGFCVDVLGVNFVFS